MRTKICSRCKKRKLACNFRIRKGGVLDCWCLGCNSECSKKRYLRDKERILAVSRKWKESNRDRLKEFERKRHKIRYAKESGKIKKRVKKYLALNTEKVKIIHSAYYQKHKNEIKLRIKEYKKVNIEKVRVWSATGKNKRRARLKGGGRYSSAEWRSLCSRFKFKCICPSHWKRMPFSKLTADHVISLVNGGTNTIDNIQPLCLPCNQSKGKRNIDYRPQAEHKLLFTDAKKGG